AVEEGVYRVFQRRQGLQRGSVIAALEGGIGLRLDGRQRIIKRSFGSLLEQAGIDLGGDLALDLLQDIADALVGSSQALGLRKRGKGAHSGKALHYFI